jgi:hypothetical protein
MRRRDTNSNRFTTHGDREESPEIIKEEVILDETFVSERIKDSVTDFAEIKYNLFRKGILTLMKTIIFFRLIKGVPSMFGLASLFNE